MSFLAFISVIALLAMLPVLWSLQRTAVAGAREFATGCLLCMAATGAMTAAAALQMPLAIVLGHAALTVAFVFILTGYGRLLDLSLPVGVFVALAFAGGVTGFAITLGGHDSLPARMIVIGGLAAMLILAAGPPAADRWPKAKPVMQVAILAAAAVACAASVHVFGRPPHPSAGVSEAPPSIAFELSLAALSALLLPVLFFAVIVTVQNRVIAGLRVAIARDGLTGALSRGALIEEGERIFAECLAHGRPLAFLLLDLDYFKQINDRYGHACGDMALAHFADVVSTFLGERGILGRIGGEEFGVILPGHTEEQATALAEDICRTVRETPAGRAQRRIRLTVSIGIAAAVPDDTITDVMIRADLALYDSKADGRDRCSIARRHQIDASSLALAAAAAQLRAADPLREQHLAQTA